MHDKFDRQITYLRLSVTDRCNLRCVYCMPKKGIKLQKHNEILTFETIYQIAKTAVKNFGFKKIRLTGGEPLVRKNILNLIKMLAKIKNIEDLTMTTNGILLKQYAKHLKLAGLNRINISLDTLDPIKYRTITRGGDIHMVLQGIDSALDANLTPLKINCVITQATTEKDILMVNDFAKKKGINARFIKQMDFALGIFQKIEGGEAGDCKNCNRIRVLSNGNILPCLFSEQTFSISKLGINEALYRAIQNKPKNGIACSAKHMTTVGG